MGGFKGDGSERLDRVGKSCLGPQAQTWIAVLYEQQIARRRGHNSGPATEFVIPESFPQQDKLKEQIDWSDEPKKSFKKSRIIRPLAKHRPNFANSFLIFNKGPKEKTIVNIRYGIYNFELSIAVKDGSRLNSVHLCD